MAQIPFTRQEMQTGWSKNFQAYKKASPPIHNAHRLLLFYAIECGLKAILMKRQGAELTSDCEDIARAQHDIDRLLQLLGAESALELNKTFSLPSLTSSQGKPQQRSVHKGKINQVWRYGGEFINNDSKVIEDKLLMISQWIMQELN
jgi:hypothetical protein